ncbi:DMT family transporter [Brucella melitensis]|uniref:DMT family transporter n=1 Tax=Brucella melitensis TaxID=29459 RepID=UPI000F5CA371|nr:DMT family transporter [Brucella melitensis]AZH16565.1 DMT family transporter [Brucella melitensis]
MNKTAGWINGFLGVLIFSGSLPATRLAVIDIDPTFLTMARASIAGLLGMVFLRLFREPFPRKSDAVSLVVVALGVVVGFPLLTGLALQHMTSARAIVFIGLLPLSTAIFAVLRGGERPRPLFWLFSVVGSLVVASYAYGQGSQSTLMGDGLMLAAIIVCGLGYAEGARLSRRLGGWQVICWALVFALPVMLPLSVFTRPETWNGIGAMAWGGLAYVSLFSMLIGFVFWYRGLAQGGTATVGQLQLLQPFFGLMLAAGVAGEPVSMGMVATAAVVVVCVAGAKKFA